MDGKGAQMSGENTDGFHEASVLQTHRKRRVENVLSSCAKQSEPQQMPMNVVRFLGSPESSEFTTHIPM